MTNLIMIPVDEEFCAEIRKIVREKLNHTIWWTLWRTDPEFAQILHDTFPSRVPDLSEPRKNTTEPLEFDSLKLSDEERRKRFGARLKLFRQALGVKQNELAARLGISPQALSMYETGRKEPNLRNLIALTRALHATTDSLLGEPCLLNDRE